MRTTTLLPCARVTTYDLGKKNIDAIFATFDKAMHAIERLGTKTYNVYRIEKINSTWRTDWELVCCKEPNPEH